MQTQRLTILACLFLLPSLTSAQSLKWHRQTNPNCANNVANPDDYVYYDRFTGNETIVHIGTNPTQQTNFTFPFTGGRNFSFIVATNGSVNWTNSSAYAVHATTTGLDGAAPVFGTPTCSGQANCANGIYAVVTTGASPAFGGIVCDGAARTSNMGVTEFYVLGASTCNTNSPVTVTMTSATGFNPATKVHVNVFVGASGSGWAGQFFLDSSTHTQTLTIPGSLAHFLEGGPVSISIAEGSYAYDTHDAPITFSLAASPSTFTCGASIAVSLTGHVTSETVTPTPSPVPTATAATSATPPTSPSPAITPGAFGSPTPIPPGNPTPTPNVNVSNGGAKTDVVIDNTNDFYGPMRKALEDEGRGLSAPGDGEGGGGAFGTGNGTHDGGDYDDRGHVDDLESELGNAESARTDVVNGISGKISGLLSTATSLGGQTFGSVSSISMNFGSIGTAPAVGQITLPTSIDLTAWSGMIGVLRLVLLWLIRIAFFVLVFRLCSAQGVRA